MWKCESVCLSRRNKAEQDKSNLKKFSFSSAARLLYSKIPLSFSNKAKSKSIGQKEKPQSIWKTTKLCVLKRIMLPPTEVVYLKLCDTKRELKIMTITECIYCRLLGSWLAGAGLQRPRAESKEPTQTFFTQLDLSPPLSLHTVSGECTIPSSLAPLTNTIFSSKLGMPQHSCCLIQAYRPTQFQAWATIWFWNELLSSALLTSAA